MPSTKLSACCKAVMRRKIKNRPDCYWECLNCKEACDPAFTGEESDLKQCNECLTMKHIVSGIVCARCEEKRCSVCHESLGEDVRATCLCLPSHGVYHPACSPHKVDHTATEEEDWYEKYAIDFNDDRQTVYSPEVIPNIVAEATRRERERILAICDSIEYSKKEYSVMETTWNILLRRLKELI